MPHVFYSFINTAFYPEHLNLKMTEERSKRRSLLSLVFIIKCISKNLLIRFLSSLRKEFTVY